MSAQECQPFQELLSDLAEGELEGLEAARVEAHVASCAACAREVVLFRGVVGSLVKIGEEEAPAELARRVMAHVQAPTLAERLVGLLLLPFNPSFLRVAVPAAAVVLLAVALRPLVPDNRVPQSPEHIAGVPVWWGGNLVVNGVPHGPNRSGRLGLKPGDSVRTAEKVEAALPISTAHVEVKPNTTLKVDPDGLWISEGEILVRIDSKDAAQEPFRVATANAVIEHIGTVFKVSTAPGEFTRTEVFQGRVRVISRTGEVREIGASEYVSVTPAGAIDDGASVAGPASLGPQRSGAEEVRSISQPLPGAPR